MDEQFMNPDRPTNPRRKKRTQMQIFKETYLPVLIAGVALVLIVVFVIGSITRGVQKNRAEKEASLAESSSLAAEQARLEQVVDTLIAQADHLMKGYDYNGAIALLNSFEGDISKFTRLNDKILECEAALSALVAWDDPSKITNLSFQLLIADPARGYSHASYGYSINRNFITTEEFTKILKQLYENGYILVDWNDFITEETNANGATVYKSKTLYLPKGKKPIMLTQTNVNYNYYLIDSDGDKVPDANGGGFASKLIWDGSRYTCQMVDGNGQTVTGAYDMVPILEDFIAKHPDFSYCGAKATLALTGYNGLFGYRTQASASENANYQQDLADVKTLIAALRKSGYTLACYTYENIPYGSSSVAQIKNDLNNWTTEVAPILGKVDMLVYAQLTDISTDETYSGEKYDTLRDLGFRYYLGFCDDGKPWATITNEYVRQGRILVTGAALAHHADWFTGLFDASSVLDPARGNVPN